jgi:hypothetical protein
MSKSENSDLPHKEPFQTPALAIGKPRLENFDDLTEVLDLEAQAEILGDLVAPGADLSEWNVLRN